MNNVSDKISITQTITRLKISKAADVKASPFTGAEQKLMDLLDIKPEAQNKLLQSRKANAYLQFFGAALKWLNGGKVLDVTPVYSSSVETKKIDTKI